MSKRTTIKDVAVAAGVSPATVSYVLNGKQNITEETKQRVYDAIAQLDYVPNLSARGLSMRDSKLIGVVIPQTEPGSRLMFENDFYSEVVGSIEYHARLRGYHVIISATDANESYMILAKERNLDGIIVIGMYPDEFYQQMKRTHIPIVLIDSYCNDHYYHNIRINDRYGSYIATQYIIDSGHREIGFFCGQIKESGVMESRLEGYRDALKENGIPFHAQNVFEGNVDYDSGIELAGRLHKKRPEITAVCAAADIIAVGAIKGFYELGMKIPEDISIVGFDDLKIAKYMTPGLTTVKQEISLKGERAVELLFQSMNHAGIGKREEILPVTLVVRDSVKSLNRG